MKYTYILFFIGLFINLTAQTNSKEVYVKPYVKSNGTVVEGHYRTAPNSTNRDNFSTKGNTNPHTGKPGYVPPDNSSTFYNYNPPSISTNSNSNTNFNFDNSKYNSKIYNSNETYSLDESYSYSSPPKPINLGLNEMLNFTQKKDWDYINDILLDKGWTYNNSEKGDAINSITWSFDKDYSTDKARGWFYVYTYNEVPAKIAFNFFNKTTYNNIKSSISKNGFKLTDTKIDDDNITATYSNANYVVKLVTSKSETDNSIVSYVVRIIKKGGYFDQDNGPKEEFDEAGNLKYKYYLKEGKISGPVTAYNENGSLSYEAKYTNGVLNGVKKFYDQYGNLTEESNFINGELNGPFVIYNNGNIIKKGGIKNGKYEGNFYEYNEDGKIAFEYYYKNGVLEGKYCRNFYNNEGKLSGKYCGLYSNDLENGLWRNIILDSKEEKTIEFWNYTNGELNGDFKEIKNDSIFIGNYKNGLLNGSLNIYSNRFAVILGQDFDDSLNWKLIETGEYFNGEKNGYWKYFYDLTGNISKEGNYIKDEKQGAWKYYIDNLIDNEKNSSSANDNLYLISNYQNGNKNGKEEQYSSIIKTQIPCDTHEKNTIEDSCYSYKRIFFKQVANYKNGEPNGEYIYEDTSGITLIKGNYIAGEKNGFWLESIKVAQDSGKSAYKFQEGNYKQGIRDGEWISYYKKDCINKIYIFEEGVLNGKCSEYACPNRKLSDRYYENGVFVKLSLFDSLGLGIQYEYEISDVKPNSYKCNYTTYDNSGSVSQEYTMLKKEDEDIDSDLFEINFLFKAILDTIGAEAYPDGKYRVADKKERVLIEGNVYKFSKLRFWNLYNYEKNILVVLEYVDNEVVRENYLTIENRQPYSGKYKGYNANGSISCDIDVENGLKDGKTKLYTEDGKLKAILKYKKGVLKKIKNKT